MPQTLTREDLFDLYQETVENIDEMEDSGVIDEYEADAHRQNLLSEFQEHLSTLEGYDPSELDEYEELVEVHPNNEFGAFLMQHGLDRGYDDFSEYIDDLADACDCDPEDIIEIIVGDEEPSDEEIEAIAGVLDLEGDEADEYYDAADYDPDEDDSDGEDLGDAEMSAYGYYNSEDPSVEYEERISDLEGQIAEFNNEMVLKDAVADIDRRAQELVERGDLPPAAYNIIMGEFENENDRLAAFSQVAVSNGVGIDSELHAVSKVLDVFDRLGLGEVGMFDQMVEDEVSEFAMNESLAAVEQAARNRAYAKKKKAGIA